VKILLLIQWGHIYNRGWLFDYPHDYLTPYDFPTYMTLYIPCVSFGIPLYNTFKYNIHDPQQWCGIWPLMKWHDMKLLTWTAWWCGNVNPLLLLSVGCILEDSFLFTSTCLGDEEYSMISSLEWWSQTSAPLLSLDQSTCKFSCRRIFESSSPYSSSCHDMIWYMFLQFTHDNMTSI